MATTDSTGSAETTRTRKGYTPPKGRPTARNNRRATRSGLSPIIEWIIVVFVLIAIFGAIFYFGRDIGDGGGGVSTGAVAIARSLTG